MGFSRSFGERLVKAIARESSRGLWAVLEPEGSVLIGCEGVGMLRIHDLDSWDGKYEELEQRVLSLIGAWIAGHRVGFGPKVELLEGSGAFPFELFTEREKRYLEFVKWLQESGRLER